MKAGSIILYKNKIVTQNIYSCVENSFFGNLFSILKVIRSSFYPIFFIYFVPVIRLSHAFTSIIVVVLDRFGAKSRSTFV